MKIILMRHGKTVWNEKGITQGRSNNRLSKAGIEVAKSVAQKLKSEKIDVIFASPLMRTMQTANLVNSFHNVKIIKNQNLIEIDQGFFTGKSKFDLSPKLQQIKNARSSEYGLESYDSVQKRAEEFLSFLSKQDYTCVLIVTHNLVATTISLLLQNEKVDQKSLIDNEFKNAETRVFEIN